MLLPLAALPAATAPLLVLLLLLHISLEQIKESKRRPLLLLLAVTAIVDHQVNWPAEGKGLENRQREKKYKKHFTIHKNRYRRIGREKTQATIENGTKYSNV